jgi:TPR repeat protein
MNTTSTGDDPDIDAELQRADELIDAGRASEGLATLERLARGGMPAAMYQLARCRHLGRGCDVDVDAALPWLRLAAEAGLRVAQSALGNMLARGQDVGQDIEAALPLLESAMADGDPLSALTLGQRYNHGAGPIAPDRDRALRCFERAAELGSVNAMRHLTRLYATGDGVPHDEAASLRWNMRAAEAGSPEAMYECANGYATGRGAEPDPALARQLYQAAGAAGHPRALHNLASMHARGVGGPVDFAAANSLYIEAAMLGSPLSRLNLSKMARYGQGREPSEMVALGWLIDCPRSDEPEVDAAIVAERDALMQRLDAEDIEAARDVSAHVERVLEEALQRQRGRLS